MNSTFEWALETDVACDQQLERAKAMQGVLPHVRQEAIGKVHPHLPVPETCHYCDGTVELVSNDRLYGRRYGRWPYVYRCTGCGASVGLHPDTHLPLGYLADAETRAARKANKTAFRDLQRRDRSTSRSALYAWLAGELGIPKRNCHWAMFDAATARRAGQICREALDASTH